MSPLFICACNKFELPVAWRSPTGVKLRVATADLCLVCLLCFRSTCNGIERSSPSHHTINLVYIYIYIWIIRIRSYFCLWFSYRSVSYRTFSLSCTHQCVTKSDFIRWRLPFFSHTWPFVLHAPVCLTFFNRNFSLCLHLLINSLRLFNVAVCGWHMM